MTSPRSERTGKPGTTTWRIGTDRWGTDRRTNGVGRPCRAGGFTLVEVIVVALVLAILLTATLPRFQGTARRLEAERAAVGFTQLLRYGHIQAVTRGEPIQWVWDPDARRASLARVGMDGERLGLDEGAAQGRPVEADVTVQLSRGGRGTDHVTFQPDGTCDALEVDVASDGAAYAIQVDAATSQAILRPGILP